MSIKQYCGIMGSGKTYEVVVEVIFNSIRQGRRVVSNIAGLNYELICDLLVEEGLPREHLGQLVQVSHEQVKEAIFWRTDTDDVTGRQPFIQKGDVVCLDENWRFWNGFGLRDDDGNKCPAEVMNFFRMHRQFPDPVSGYTCEIVLISQDPKDFARRVCGVTEQIFFMTKLTALGMNNNYRVDIHSRKISRNPIRSLQRTYNEKYFPCYKSHSQQVEGGAAAVESTIDDRGNIFKGAMFKVGIPVVAILLLTGGYGLWRFLHPANLDKFQNDSIVQSSSASAQPGVFVSNNRPELSSEWRSVGWYRNDHSITVTLQNSTGQIRSIANPPNYKLSSSGVEVELPEGGFATPWASISKRAGVGFP